jgi:hypothetical protein
MSRCSFSVFIFFFDHADSVAVADVATADDPLLPSLSSLLTFSLPP